MVKQAIAVKRKGILMGGCKHHVNVGDRFRKRLPYSEVCAYMHVANRHMLCELVSETAVQLYDDNGKPFSHPISRTEAGIHRDDKGRLFYVL